MLRATHLCLGGGGGGGVTKWRNGTDIDDGTDLPELCMLSCSDV